MDWKDNLQKPLAKKMKTLLLVAAAGAFMILLANITDGYGNSSGSSGSGSGILSGNNNQTNSTSAANNPLHSNDSEIPALEDVISRRLEGILGQIDGVGQVKVTVNLASTAGKEFAINKNTDNKETLENDQRGGKRTTTESNEGDQMVVVRGGDGNGEIPVVVKETKPEVKGVIVVADGVENAEVKANVMKATQVYLDIPLHKVIVLPREGR